MNEVGAVQVDRTGLLARSSPEDSSALNIYLKDSLYGEPELGKVMRTLARHPLTGTGRQASVNDYSQGRFFLIHSTAMEWMFSPDNEKRGKLNKYQEKMRGGNPYSCRKDLDINVAVVRVDDKRWKEISQLFLESRGEVLNPQNWKGEEKSVPKVVAIGGEIYVSNKVYEDDGWESVQKEAWRVYRGLIPEDDRGDYLFLESSQGVEYVVLAKEARKKIEAGGKRAKRDMKALAEVFLMPVRGVWNENKGEIDLKIKEAYQDRGYDPRNMPPLEFSPRAEYSWTGTERVEAIARETIERSTRRRTPLSYNPPEWTENQLYSLPVALQALRVRMKQIFNQCYFENDTKGFQRQIEALKSQVMELKGRYSELEKGVLNSENEVQAIKLWSELGSSWAVDPKQTAEIYLRTGLMKLLVGEEMRVEGWEEGAVDLAGRGVSLRKLLTMVGTNMSRVDKKMGSFSKGGQEFLNKVLDCRSF